MRIFLVGEASVTAALALAMVLLSGSTSTPVAVASPATPAMALSPITVVEAAAESEGSVSIEDSDATAAAASSFNGRLPEPGRQPGHPAARLDYPREEPKAMATITWAGRSIDDTIARQVDTAADRAAIPRNLLRAAVLGESEGRADVIGDSGASVGLLQLHERGQGEGLSVAMRADPVTNLKVGVPPIAAAWSANSHLSGRNRVERTMAESGHPGDPDSFTKGSRTWTIARDGIARISDIWERLEADEPSGAGGGTQTPFGFSAEGIQSGIDELSTLAREHPVATAAFGIAALIALAL